MKIIVIEDDHFFQNFYSLKLKELGYQVDIAVDGQDALNKIKASPPSLILLDLIMPVMDGFQFLEEIRKDALLNKIPIIVFSTLGQESDVKKAMSLGAVDYINKSFFDFSTFINRVVKYLPKT